MVKYTGFYKGREYLFRVCKKCGVEYRAERGSWKLKLRFCRPHRTEYFKFYKQKYGYYHPNDLKRWKLWVTKNLEHRRQQALLSYHKNKMKPVNKVRKHRATKINQESNL